MNVEPERWTSLLREVRQRAIQLGFSGCDPKALARDLKLDSRALLEAFPNHLTLAEAILEADFAAQCEEVGAAMTSDQPPTLRLGAVLRGWIFKAWDDSQRASQRLLREMAALDAPSQSQESHRMWITQRLREILEQGAVSGEFDMPDTQRMAELIHLVASSLAPPRMKRCPADLPMTLQDLTDLILRALEPPMMVAD